MDYRKLIAEWQTWQNEDPEDWKEFRNSLRDRKAREESPYEFDCDLWETYKDHHLCDVCMIESCIPRRYKMGRRQEEEYYAFIGEPDQFWQPGPAAECKTYEASEYTQEQLERLAKGLNLR